MRTTIEVNNRLNRITNNTIKRLSNIFDDIDENTIIDNEPPERIVTNNEIRISDLINDNFYELFSINNPIKAPYRIFKGGRSSFKSSSISLKLVLDFISDDKRNVLCLRKVATYLSTSIYEQIKWAIYAFGLEDEFTFLKSPLKIVHNKTNTAFYFFGVDDPQKIKSAKVAIGYIGDIFYEEATEFESKEEIDTVNDTFIRQDLPDDKEVNIYFAYNPPRNPYNWLNEWVEELIQSGDPDYYIHHSTYEDDKKGFLSDQFLRRVLRVKQTDPDYHDWMYLGKVIGLGDTVYNFNLFNVIDKLDDILDNDERLILSDIGIDSGYSVSATTFLFIGLTNKGKTILLDTYYYSPVNRVNKKAPSDFSKDLWRFIQTNITEYNNIPLDTLISDSADGALRNQFFKDYGWRLTPVAKKEKIKMIENVQDILAQNKVYVLNTKNNKIFLDEHKKYQWDEKSLEKGKEPKVLKVDDHTCDAFQYYVNSNMQKLGLK